MATTRDVTVFFDVGHTLVTGGEMSPRRLIGHRLGLSEESMRRVGKLIMTTPLETREALVEALLSFVDHPEPSYLRRVLGEIWDEQMYCIELLPGVEEVVGTLVARGCTLGIVSNIWHPFYEGFRMRYPQVAGCFRYRVLSYREGVKKPSGEIYRRAKSLAGGGECWMVGDTYEMDIAPARASGFRTAWFLIRPEREREVLVRVLRGEVPSPDVVLSDLRELLAYVC